MCAVPLLALAGSWPVAAYGTSWMLGSALLGWLCDVSPRGVAVAAIVIELGAVPLILAGARASGGSVGPFTALATLRCP